MRSLFTIFLLFPPTPPFFLCIAFLSHLFPFIFCISYPSEPLVLFSLWGKWEEYNGAAPPEMRRGWWKVLASSVLSLPPPLVISSLEECKGHWWPRVPWKSHSSTWIAHPDPSLGQMLLRDGAWVGLAPSVLLLPCSL